MTVQRPQNTHFPAMDFSGQNFHYCSVFAKNKGIYSDRIKLLEGDYVLVKKSRCAIYGKFRFDGEVKITLRNGTFFTGMLDFERKSLGRCTVVSRTSTFVGKMLNGLRHGLGAEMFENGDQFVGLFDHNERHGEGRFVTCEGNVYEGVFERGSFVSGTLTCVEGSEFRKYKGNFFPITDESPTQRICTGTITHFDGREEKFVDGVKQDDEPELDEDSPLSPTQTNLFLDAAGWLYARLQK